MRYWTINKDTREVVGEGDRDKWNIPRNALLIEPLSAKEGFSVVANADLSGTEYVEDHRGKTIYSIDGSGTEKVEELGPVKEGWTLKVRPTTFHVFNSDIQDWELTPTGEAEQLNAHISEAKYVIDQTALSILSQWTAFADSYVETEAEAIAFTDAGYTGDMGPNLSAYATASGISPKTAAINVLKKAEALRAAKTELNVIRSGKHALSNLTDLDEIEELRQDIVNRLLALGETI